MVIIMVLFLCIVHDTAITSIISCLFCTLLSVRRGHQHKDVCQSFSMRKDTRIVFTSKAADPPPPPHTTQHTHTHTHFTGHIEVVVKT
jgi:hypothetical protein